MFYLPLSSSILETEYASPERTNQESIINDFNLLKSDSFIVEMLNAFPSFVAVLNKERQIVYSNEKLKNVFSEKELENIIGNRPGEIFNCLNIDIGSKKCGTTAHCKYCGAVNSIIEAQNKNIQSKKECRIAVHDEESFKSFEFNVTTTPFLYKDTQLYIFILEDISTKKRKLALERVFFHDVLNTASSLKALHKLLKKYDFNEEALYYINLVGKVSQNLIEEIEQQKDISLAEEGDLKLHPQIISTKQIILDTVETIEKHEVAFNKTIAIFPNTLDKEILIDILTLRRVLLNMLKNALEATPKGGTISIGCKEEGCQIVFWVKNKGVIPGNVQSQIFSRTFSTKGNNRGLGTYSMKLFGEKYLKGEISFESSEETDTVFYFRYTAECL